jgi:hypothetical protein
MSPRAEVIAIGFALTLSACAGSGTELARTTFKGSGAQDLAVSVPAATTLHFDTTIDVRLSSVDKNTINDEWTYTIETVRDGSVKAKTACDAFNVGPGIASSRSGDRLRLSRSRILGCTVSVNPGDSTLRMTLAPTRGFSSVAPMEVELFVMR